MNADALNGHKTMDREQGGAMSGQTDDALLTEVQRIETIMLKELLKVCEKHHLKCFADGGTLLGAVRHQGFIPWDDDIDIVMLRADYDRLLEIGKTAFEAPIFFQSADTDKEYYRPHVQLRYEHTTAILPIEMHSAKFHQGIFIDVFPLDGVSDKRWKNSLHWAEVKFWRRMLDLLYSTRKRKNRFLHLIQKLAYRCLGSRLDIRWFQKQLRRACVRHPNGPMVTLICIHETKDKDLFKKEWFAKIKHLPFEDTMVPVAENYDAILRVKYGDDYMIPKRLDTLHGKMIIDPYTGYMQTKNRF